MSANYDEIIERIAAKSLWDFPGGVHPPQQKHLSNASSILDYSIPEYLYIPVKQHIGTKGQMLVSKGDYVKKGQALSTSDSPFSVPVHASSSGTVEDITQHVSAHPSGLSELTIVIKTDGLDAWTELSPIKNYTQAGKSELIEAIANAGISGMGGAGFPTHIKANDSRELEFLIINGVECEPYISSDDRLMREHAWQIRQGIDILVHLLKPRQVLVAIEDNKPEAIETLSMACQQQSRYQVVSIPTKYPAGGEKQLIQVLTSREVPSNGLPVDVGCMMFNVGTCFAISDAIIEGKALTQRVVTLSGTAFKEPKNVWALLGTSVSDLLPLGQYEQAAQSQARIIMGGPMMGFTVASGKVPIVKTSNCLLAAADDELAEPEDERACIRCSACSDACPASLLPQQLYWHSKAKEYDKAEEYSLFDCIECGACAYVCPSEIPLVHYYRKAKADISLQKEEKEKAEKARVRFEARQARLLREKEEREEKHRKAAEARKQAMSSDGGAAKDKIAAALARAKAKKQAKAQEQPESNDTPQTQQKSAEAEVTNVDSPNTANVDDPKKAKVAAAIARAKAKKLAQQKALNAKSAGESSESDEAEVLSEKPDLKETKQESPESVESTEQSPEDRKKAKVAAAVARAKAKKAARAKENQKTPDEES